MTGLSFQEEASGAQAPALYGLSIFIIYLCLAALYESWAIPLSVMLVIPLGVIGAVAAAYGRGLFNDIYFQVGLLTTIGLSAKNAILIVEFAVDNEKRGQKAFDAAMNAARVRLRPILMTSIAFIAGVSPLALGNAGAGAASQNEDIGTGVIGGMLTSHHTGDLLRAGVLRSGEQRPAAPRITAAYPDGHWDGRVAAPCNKFSRHCLHHIRFAKDAPAPVEWSAQRGGQIMHGSFFWYDLMTTDTRRGGEILWRCHRLGRPRMAAVPTWYRHTRSSRLARIAASRD